MASQGVLLGSILLTAGAIALAGCSGSGKTPSLSKSGPEVDPSTVPVPPADGPKLAIQGAIVAVMDRPSHDGKPIGWLRAGALATRSVDAVTKRDCPGGWYPIRPRGFLCVGQGATLDLRAGAQAAGKAPPRLDAPLPYSYARTTEATPLYEWDKSKGAAVKETGKIRRGSGVALVGEWDAQVPDGSKAHLALTPDGKFVDVANIKPVEAPAFKGIEIAEQAKLPVAFVLKQGVRYWHVQKDEAEKRARVECTGLIPLTGKFRTVRGENFWATEQDGKYLRHKDVTLIPKRHVYPDFANGDQKWIDVSIVTGALVAYEGRKPVYATLVSPGRERFGDPKTTASTAMGTFHVVGKQITSSQAPTKPFAEEADMRDAPWVLELSSGQVLHGAYWHSRFGVEHGAGNVALAPTDALWLFRWATPELPEGWHGVTAAPDSERKTLVVIHK